MNSISTKSAKETKALGMRVAKKLKGGDILGLMGELGSGKTTFVQGLAEGLGISVPVTSPTFILVKCYPVEPPARVSQFCHVDLYRLEGDEEIESIGLTDFLHTPDTVVAIEWAEKIRDKLPDNAYFIEFLPLEGRHQITLPKELR